MGFQRLRVIAGILGVATFTCCGSSTGDTTSGGAAADEAESVYRSFSLQTLPTHFKTRLNYPSDFLNDFWKAPHATPNGPILLSLEVEVDQRNPNLAKYYDLTSLKKLDGAPDDWSDPIEDTRRLAGTYEIKSKSYVDTLEKLFAQRQRMVGLLGQRPAAGADGDDCLTPEEVAAREHALSHFVFHYHVSFPFRRDAGWIHRVTSFLAVVNSWGTTVSFDRSAAFAGRSDEGIPVLAWLYGLGIEPMDARALRVVQCTLERALAGSDDEAARLFRQLATKFYATGMRGGIYKTASGDTDPLRLGFEVRVLENDKDSAEWLLANIVRFLEADEQPVKLGDAGSAYPLGLIFPNGANCMNPRGVFVATGVPTARRLASGAVSPQGLEGTELATSTRTVFEVAYPHATALLNTFFSDAMIDFLNSRSGNSVSIDPNAPESASEHDVRERFTYFAAPLYELSPFVNSTPLQTAILDIGQQTSEKAETMSINAINAPDPNAAVGQAMIDFLMLPTEWSRQKVLGVDGLAHWM